MEEFGFSSSNKGEESQDKNSKKKKKSPKDDTLDEGDIMDFLKVRKKYPSTNKLESQLEEEERTRSLRSLSALPSLISAKDSINGKNEVQNNSNVIIKKSSPMEIPSDQLDVEPFKPYRLSANKHNTTLSRSYEERLILSPSWSEEDRKSVLMKMEKTKAEIEQSKSKDDPLLTTLTKETESLNRLRDYVDHSLPLSVPISQCCESLVNFCVRPIRPRRRSVSIPRTKKKVPKLKRSKGSDEWVKSLRDTKKKAPQAFTEKSTNSSSFFAKSTVTRSVTPPEISKPVQVLSDDEGSDDEEINCFDYIPEELILTIFTFLDLVTLARCQRVCTQWRALIQLECAPRMSLLFENFRLRMYGDPLMPEFLGLNPWIKVPKTIHPLKTLFSKEYNPSKFSKKIDTQIQENKQLRESMVSLLTFGDPKCKQMFYNSLRSNSKFCEEVVGPNILEMKCFHFANNKTPLKVVDYEKQLTKSCKKWIHMFDDIVSVVFCIDLYGESGSETKSVNRYLRIFKKLFHSRWYRSTPVILLFYSTDRDEKVTKTNGVPTIRFTSHPRSGVSVAIARSDSVADKFTSHNYSRSRGIYKYCTTENDKYFADVLSETIRDILVTNLVDKLF